MGALGSKGSEDAVLDLKIFGWASKTRHSETPQAGSESVTRASNKQTLMSTDDRLTRFGQPQRFALSQVQGDGWSSNSALDAGDTELSFSLREKVPEGRMRGFTLAEVLITLGIIGVVAALTIPTLMQNLNRRDTIAKVKSFYANATNAIKLAEAEYGTMEKWQGVTNQDVYPNNPEEYTKYNLNATDWVGYKYIIDNLKTAKICGATANLCGMSTEQYHYYNGSAGNYFTNPAIIKVQLANGSPVTIWNHPSGCSNETLCGTMGIDTNGEKGPNVTGIDYFEFRLFPNGSKVQDTGTSCHKEKDHTGNSCFGYILFNDNMDYLD